jgi:uncharacterized protein
MLRIDAHNHISPDFPTGIRDGHTSQTAEDLVEDLDRCGFDAAVIFAEPYDWNYGHAHPYVEDSAARYPQRLIPVALVNPRTGIEGLNEAERFVREGGARGIKVRPDSQSCPANCEAVRNVLRLAERINIPVFIHSGSTTEAHPLTIADLVADFPNVTVIMQHMFDLTGKHCIRVAERYSNVLLESSGVYSPYLIREAVETLGDNRVLFGSDSPYLPRELELLKITSLHLPRLSEERLLGGNAALLFGL